MDFAARIWPGQEASNTPALHQDRRTANSEASNNFQGQTEERDKYDNDVDVYFQVNAWIDTEINMDQPHPAQWTC